MSLNFHNLFCDESGIDSGPQFYLGAMICTPTRARILAGQLEGVRETYGLEAEMKWTRVSRAMLPAYKAFVDVFLNCKYSRFQLYSVQRGPHWRAFGRDEEQRFFKSYYVFLRRTMSLYSQYDIYVDDKPGKRYRWSNVKWAINGAASRDHGLAKRQVKNLHALDSKQCDLIQLTDVLLGALTSSASSPHKQELSRYIREQLKTSVRCRLQSEEWSPRLELKPSSRSHKP